QRILRQHVIVRGQGRPVLTSPGQVAGLRLELPEFDPHCANVIRSVKCDPVPAPAAPDVPLLAAARALGLEELGRSVAGRWMGGRRFGGPGPAVLLFGGIHGDEPGSVEVLLDLAARLPAAPAAPLWLVPVANPDGIARGTKNSARDVDLNRNFPAR